MTRARSGRKYKSCCRKRVEDAAAENRTFLTEEMRDAAASARAWEVDAVPVNVGVSDGGSRPVLLLVVGAGLVLGIKMLDRLAGDPGQVCTALEQAIVRAAGEVGTFPSASVSDSQTCTIHFPRHCEGGISRSKLQPACLTWKNPRGQPSVR